MALRTRVASVDARGVFVACDDSAALVPGLRLSFVQGKRTLARGRIERVLDAHLAVAQLTQGTLAPAKRLDRLRVLAEAGAAPRVLVLRVGVPGDGRACMAFPCDRAQVTSPLADGGYRIEAAGRGEYQLLRSSTLPDSAAWPDTLLVRTFGKAVDEEIALERGELDVAVFWPGELSNRLRMSELWRDFARGTLARGLFAALGGDSTRTAPSTPLNEQLFGGDLLDWSDLTGAPAPTPGSMTRFSVDALMPGHAVIERVLAQSVPAGTAATSARFSWLSVPLAARDSLAAEWRGRAITPLYALRCPVLCTPASRALVRTLGADGFANLVQCAP
jgi:hypothetical protein